jgi:phosphatidate cytidylyltransferase
MAAREMGDRFEIDSAEIEMDSPEEAPQPLEQDPETPVRAPADPALETAQPAATGPTRRGRTGETTARVLWVVPWIVFAILIIVAGGVTFATAVAGLGILGLRELFRMTEGWRPFAPAAYLTLAGMIFAAHFGDQFQMVLVAVLSFPLMFVLASRRADRRDVTISLAITIFAVVWIGLPLAHAVLLRDLPHHGGGLLVDVLVATFLCDTAAYGAGRLFGSHRITPRISPNKTFEGLLGGFVGGTFGFWFAGLYQDWLPGLDALAMGACVSVLAPMGDLFASMVKRDLDVKDTGRLFGPHGGLVDRLDAVLFTVVAGYYLSLAFVY